LYVFEVLHYLCEMEKSLDIVNKMVSYLQKYSNENGKEPGDFKEFVLWLNEYVIDPTQTTEKRHENHIDIELTFLLIMQSKHYKMYCKKALLNSEINTPDGYSFLYHLTLVESFRKMELINIHLLEAPTGIEVIKRLLKKELIEEYDDKDDKRAKRVRITEKGKNEVEKLAPLMQEVYSNMSAEMNMNEKLHIISFLKKFNNYHVNNEIKK
jgi:DNA-binding MarR family transcriptional regulator